MMDLWPHQNSQVDDLFGLAVPKSCNGVPTEILTPKSTWADATAFDEMAQTLAKKFVDNFAEYFDQASEEIRAAAPKASN